MRLFMRFNLLLIVLYTVTVTSQVKSLNDFEYQLKQNLGEYQDFKKQIIDLNNDQLDDVIYLYGCGEPNCISVLLNNHNVYKIVIEEQCFNYNLFKINAAEYHLDLTLYHCCGDSPYMSKREFVIADDKAVLLDNYVKIDEDYIGHKVLTTPQNYNTSAYFVTNTVNDYNLRFSPTIELFDKKLKESFTFGCEEGTNIISKINLKSTIKVLAELIQSDRTWLYVEIDGNSLNKKCNPVEFDFEHQKIRGWISNKFVTKL